MCSTVPVTIQRGCHIQNIQVPCIFATSLRLNQRRDASPILPSNRKRTGRLVRARAANGRAQYPQWAVCVSILQSVSESGEDYYQREKTSAIAELFCRIRIPTPFPTFSDDVSSVDRRWFSSIVQWITNLTEEHRDLSDIYQVGHQIETLIERKLRCVELQCSTKWSLVSVIHATAAESRLFWRCFAKLVFSLAERV